MPTALLEPAAGQVTGTHTDFPVLITPSAHTNIGTLTLAEAQSVRVYTDSGLTNEIAREVVSADEIWAKVPSLSSSSTIYFDWDGVRSDYAVTDTYGRNAVWSNYSFVSHDGGGLDSTGGRTMTANNGVTAGGASGQIGAATTFTSASSHNFSMNSTTGLPSGDASSTLQAWIKPVSVASAFVPLDLGTQTSLQRRGLYIGNYGGTGALALIGFGNDLFVRPVIVAGSWQKIDASYTTVSRAAALYDNGVSVRTGTLSSNMNTTYGGGRVGCNTGNTEFFNGDIDEVRVANSVLSANWITTEYNNQNDNAAFWDDSAVGGGGGGYRFVPQLTPFAGL